MAKNLFILKDENCVYVDIPANAIDDNELRLADFKVLCYLRRMGQTEATITADKIREDTGLSAHVVRGAIARLTDAGYVSRNYALYANGKRGRSSYYVLKDTPSRQEPPGKEVLKRVEQLHSPYKPLQTPDKQETTEETE